jgi:hypothetical protein
VTKSRFVANSKNHGQLGSSTGEIRRDFATSRAPSLRIALVPIIIFVFVVAFLLVLLVLLFII